MLTVLADKLSLKWLTAFPAVLSVVTITSPTFRALHQECTPGKPQSMTATQECQASMGFCGSPVVFERHVLNRTSSRIASLTERSRAKDLRFEAFQNDLPIA
jgi:hypothetical protein